MYNKILLFNHLIQLITILNNYKNNTITMSSFTIRCDRKAKSSRRAGGLPRIPRLAGQQGCNLGAFLKASSNVTTKPLVDRSGFVMVPKRARSLRGSFQSPMSRRSIRQPNTNSFAVLATSPPTKKIIAGPAIVKPKAPTGVWGKGPRRVKFANDSETLMKPQAAETREYEKGSVPTEFVKMPDEEEYLKLKHSKGAWRPKSVKVTVPVPTYIGAWADAVDSTDSDSEDELDTLGRPKTDLSAW